MSRFAFSVTRAKDYSGWRWDSGEPPPLAEPPRWTVSLPHQCDAWAIAEDLPREEAETELRQFIQEAQEALAALERGHEMDEDD